MFATPAFNPSLFRSTVLRLRNRRSLECQENLWLREKETNPPPFQQRFSCSCNHGCECNFFLFQTLFSIAIFFVTYFISLLFVLDDFMVKISSGCDIFLHFFPFYLLFVLFDGFMENSGNNHFVDCTMKLIL